MSKQIQKISPFLWFDTQAEEAARFYTPIFRNSKVGAVAATAKPVLVPRAA
jgi:predicted 3-demethylubiquinone-9 3-methyltransferase (glyoxalase superfamily)